MFFGKIIFLKIRIKTSGKNKAITAFRSKLLNTLFLSCQEWADIRVTTQPGSSIKIFGQVDFFISSAAVNFLT